MSVITTRDIATKPISRREILRYMGCRVADEEINTLIDKSLEICKNKLTYSVCYRELPIKTDGEAIDLGFARVSSRDLEKNLNGCDSIILFAATIGLELDRLIYRYGTLSPSVAVCLQAFGAERIEALCDAFCDGLRASGKTTVPRFSPGYGDLPLELQTDIFRALDCQKHIGLTLNDSLLMSPTKSVSAIVGIKHENT